VNGPASLPLRNVHAPPPVPWWPPAPGWWLLVLLVAVLAAAAWWWLRRHRRLRLAAVSLAQGELDGLETAFRAGEEPEEIVRRLSALLRRVCISVFPRTEAAGLTGKAWLTFLDRALSRPAFSEGPGRVLAEAPYRPSVPAGEIEPLLALAREWLAAVSRRREVKGK